MKTATTTSWPHRRRQLGERRGSSLSRILGALLGILALAAIAVGIYWFFFSSMTVDLHLKRVSVASTLAYQVTQPGIDPSAATGNGIVIPGQQVQFTLSRSLSAPATGKTIIPDQVASGEVVLRNPTDAVVTIERGTQFTAFNGVSYTLPDAVEVPAAADGQPGELTAKIHASEGGEAGNAATGMLTGQLPNGLYYSNRLAEVAGGTQKTITTVSQQDIDQLKADIDRELLALATTTELDQGLLLVPSTVQPVGGSGTATPDGGGYSFSQQVGDEADEVSVDAAVTFSATAYDPTPLIDQAIPAAPVGSDRGSILRSRIGAGQYAGGNRERERRHLVAGHRDRRSRSHVGCRDAIGAGRSARRKQRVGERANPCGTRLRRWLFGVVFAVVAARSGSGFVGSHHDRDELMADLPASGRLLGLDVGEKRIGVAVSDEGQILSSPWGMIEQGKRSIGEIGRIARETGAIAIVAGLPTGMSGREGAQAAETRRFADAVELELALPLTYWDERLTSSQAERMLIESGMRRKERRGQIDALAASLMLQSYLDARIHRRNRNNAQKNRVP